MNEYTAWDLYSAPLYNAHQDNAETINQRLEEALTRRENRSTRRYWMRRHDGPHGARYSDYGWNDRKHRLRNRAALAELKDVATDRDNTPISEELLLPGPAENYISGIYPYFDTQPEPQPQATSAYDWDDGWDEAYDTARWHVRGH